MSTHIYIRGIGSYLPDNILTNDELAQTIDTSDAWIKERTGIAKRHITPKGQNTSDLGYEAALRALQDADMSPDEVDMIVLATTTPDLTFPSTATIIQEKLKIRHGAAFDIQAVCSGFIYALSIAETMIQGGKSKTILVIGAETFSRILNWNDRTTCVLFGDGAGALVLSSNKPTGETIGKGLLSTHIRSDGRYRDLLYVNGGPSSTQSVGTVVMQGKQVFRHAVKELTQSIIECAGAADCSITDIDWLVPHQANQRILDAVAKKLELRDTQVISTIADHANTSAASIPLALDVAIKDGRIKRKDRVMLEAFGGGFTWGSALIQY